MIVNNKHIIKNLNKFNFSSIRFSTSTSNNNNNNSHLEKSKKSTSTTQTNNYCHNYFSDVQNYKSYDDNVELVKSSSNNINTSNESKSTLSAHLTEQHDYKGIFGSIKKQMAYLSKIIEHGCITFRNDRIYYKDYLLPKASVLNEPLFKRALPTFQYHNYDSYYYLNFHERKEIVQYRNDRLTFIPLAIFLSIPFSTLALPFYIKFLPGLLPRGFSERGQVLSRHDKMMALRERFSNKVLEKYELQDKVEKLFSNVKSITDISPLKIKQLDDDFVLNFSEIKRKRLKTICRSLGESTILNTNQLLQNKILGFATYIHNENEQIIKEINSLTFEDFQDLLYERSLSYRGLNYHEMKDKFIKYSQLLKSLQSIEEGSQDPLSKEDFKFKGFYKKFILLNAIIIKYKL